jgi:hypothetical protein
MNKISDNETFKKTLSSLPLSQQRQVGARFVANVLDLTDGRCTKQAQHIAEQRDISPEELENAYHAVHAVYVATHPRSDISELDYAKQAAHLVAEACMTCVSPTYGEQRTHHLAVNAANYCRMARLCSSLHNDTENPRFSDAEEAMNGEIEAQFSILNRFLEENN